MDYVGMVLFPYTGHSDSWRNCESPFKELVEMSEDFYQMLYSLIFPAGLVE
jgi:hypothetical protein